MNTTFSNEHTDSSNEERHPYDVPFDELTDKEMEVLEASLSALSKGDTLWHTRSSVWGWALGYLHVLLERATEEHPQAAIYVELLKDHDQYGISVLKMGDTLPEQVTQATDHLDK